MKIKSEAAKAGFWFTFCNVLQRGIQFLATPIYTRILTPEEYGRYSTFLTWCSLITIVATFNLASGVFNNAMVKYSNDKDGYTSSMQGLTLVTTIICSAIFLLMFKQIKPIIEMDMENISLMFFIIYFQMVIQLWSARKRYDYKYISLIIYTFIFSLLVPIFGLIFYYVMYHNEKGLIAGYAISNIVVGIILLANTWHKKLIFFNKEYWKYALKFNIPLIPHYMSNFIMSQSDRIMIKFFNGDYYAGLYSLAYQISLAATIVFQGVNNAITPWTYRKLEGNDYKEIRKVINILCIGMTIPCALILLFTPEIMLVLGGSEYIKAIWAIPPIVFSIYLLFIIPLLLNILFYFENNKMIMLSTATGATTNIILNIFLLKQYGYVAAAYTTAFGYLIITLIDYLCMKKTLIKNRIKKIYDIATFTKCILAVAIFCALCLFLYRYCFGIRFGVLFILVFVCGIYIIKHNKQIKNLIRYNQ